MIIAITGKIGSGKSTVGSLIQHLDQDSRWQLKSFAYKLKQIASILTGMPLGEDNDFTQEQKQSMLPEWGMTLRQMLQKLGTEAIRGNIHDNAWIISLFTDYIKERGYRKYLSKEEQIERRRKLSGTYTPYHFIDIPYPNGAQYPNWIITDFRFPNEAKAIRERGGFLLKVERPDNPFPQSDHPSETALDGFNEYDFIIYNNKDITHLQEQIKTVISLYNMDASFL